ncbi:MAG: DUF721 domain-containing protein [Holophagaceae bacterium]|nr:DUF721 domain-containing protein [Holophagaceae bacterium]
MREKKGRHEKERLSPIGHIISKNSAELIKLEQLKNAWSYFVGHGNSKITYPISIRNGLLVIGCHNMSVLEDLRKSAIKTWPDLCDRINSILKLHLDSLEIVPCDPEPEVTNQTN